MFTGRRCKHYFGIPLPKDWKKMYQKPQELGSSESDSSESDETVSSRRKKNVFFLIVVRLANMLLKTVKFYTTFYKIMFVKQLDSQLICFFT